MIVKKETVNRETARLLVKKADREIDCSMHLAYGPDWDDADAHEIRFDTGAQSLGEIVEIVRTLLKAKEALKKPEALESLRRQLVASRVKAAVATNPEFLIPTLEVEPRGEGILLRGVARSIREHRAIDREVKKVSGSVPVICEIHYRGIKSVKPHRIS